MADEMDPGSALVGRVNAFHSTLPKPAKQQGRQVGKPDQAPGSVNKHFGLGANPVEADNAGAGEMVEGGLADAGTAVI